MIKAEILGMIEIIQRYQKPVVELYGSYDEKCRNDSPSALHRQATALISLLGDGKLYNEKFVWLSWIDVI